MIYRGKLRPSFNVPFLDTPSTSTLRTSISARGSTHGSARGSTHGSACGSTHVSARGSARASTRVSARASTARVSPVPLSYIKRETRRETRRGKRVKHKKE